MTLTQADLQELKSVPHPPVKVKKTVAATLILMGYPVKSAEDWKTCKKFLGQSDVFKIMTGHDVSTVTSQQVAQAKAQLGGMSLEDIKNNSMAAAGLFKWVMEAILSAESSSGEAGKVTA